MKCGLLENLARRVWPHATNSNAYTDFWTLGLEGRAVILAKHSRSETDQEGSCREGIEHTVFRGMGVEHDESDHVNGWEWTLRGGKGGVGFSGGCAGGRGDGGKHDAPHLAEGDHLDGHRGGRGEEAGERRGVGRGDDEGVYGERAERQLACRATAGPGALWLHRRARTTNDTYVKARTSGSLLLTRKARTRLKNSETGADTLIVPAL